VAIAAAAGARVFQRTFDDYGAQREAARVMVSYRHSWVLAIDADERPEPELIAEIGRILAFSDAGTAAYRMRRKDMFMGRWIRHSTLYPSWFVRLYQPARIRYEERRVHEYPIVQGEVGALRSHLIHYNFSKGIAAWITKHVAYAGMEANEAAAAGSNEAIDWRAIFQARDPVRRRRMLKRIWARLPMRPLARFAYTYFLRRGILDGIPGLYYCLLLAFYELTIVLQIKEADRHRRGLPN
jgi:hypothetical protein